MATLDSTGKASKARVKEGDELIPKTSFAPIAAPGKLHGLQPGVSYEFLQNNMTYVYEDLLRIFVATKIPVTLWGPMGSGKTRTVEAMANETDENNVPYQVITVQPSTEDPTTMHGMMTITPDPRTGKKIMERSIPQMAEEVWNYYNNKDGLTVMFLDEMTTCIPAQQNALLGLLTHGRYGTMDISPYVTFAMAANPPGTVQTVLPLSEAVINRGGHIPWYTEADNFLAKWATGFGNPAKAPRERTRKFLTNLINSAPDVAFRDDPEHHESEDEGWDIAELCPYDQMHFSARSATEAAKIFELTEDVFTAAEYDIKKLYLKEAITAMTGLRWGRNSGKVMDMMEAELSTKPVIDAINHYRIDFTDSFNEVTDKVGDSLHRNRGQKMRADQEHELAEIFEQEIFNNESFAQKRYMGFWLWLSTSQDESTRAPVIPIALNILNRAVATYRKEMAKSKFIPEFVPEHIRREIMEMKQIMAPHSTPEL